MGNVTKYGNRLRHDVINDVIKTGHIFKMALKIEKVQKIIKLVYESYSSVTVIRSMRNTILRMKN